MVRPGRTLRVVIGEVQPIATYGHMTETEINPKLLTKLAELEGRYRAITEEMNDPAVATNAARIVKLAKEHSQLGRIIRPYGEYRRLRGQITEAEGIIADPTS